MFFTGAKNDEQLSNFTSIGIYLFGFLILLLAKHPTEVKEGMKSLDIEPLFLRNTEKLKTSAYLVYKVM